MYLDLSQSPEIQRDRDAQLISSLYSRSSKKSSGKETPDQKSKTLSLLKKPQSPRSWTGIHSSPRDDAMESRKRSSQEWIISESPKNIFIVDSDEDQVKPSARDGHLQRAPHPDNSDAVFAKRAAVQGLLHNDNNDDDDIFSSMLFPEASNNEPGSLTLSYPPVIAMTPIKSRAPPPSKPMAIAKTAPSPDIVIDMDEYVASVKKRTPVIEKPSGHTIAKKTTPSKPSVPAVPLSTTPTSFSFVSTTRPPHAKSTNNDSTDKIYHEVTHQPAPSAPLNISIPEHQGSVICGDIPINEDTDELRRLRQQGQPVFDYWQQLEKFSGLPSDMNGEESNGESGGSSLMGKRKSSFKMSDALIAISNRSQTKKKTYADKFRKTSGSGGGGFRKPSYGKWYSGKGGSSAFRGKSMY